MSWKGVPRKENYFPLFAEEWNLLLDAVDELYATCLKSIKGYVEGDLYPREHAKYDLGKDDLRFKNVFAVFGDFSGDVRVRGSSVVTEDCLATLEAYMSRLVEIEEEEAAEGQAFFYEITSADGGVALGVAEPGVAKKLVAAHLVHSSDTGEVWLSGSEEPNKPLLWAPASVKRVAFDTWLRLGVGEDLCLYWRNASIGSKVHVVVRLARR